MKFFFDNCISPHLAKGFAAMSESQSHTIAHLRTKFDAETIDVDWIRELGREGDWVIVSGDARITRNPAEREAWRQSGLTAFFFLPPFQTDSFWVQAAALVKWWPEISLQAKRAPKHHGYYVPKSGKTLQKIHPV